MTNENKASTIIAVDGNVSASQSSSRFEPVWGAVPDKKSLAGIVKMGRPQSKASSSSKSSHNSVNHHLVHSSPSTELNHGFSSSKDHGPKVSDLYTEPVAAPDEWPLIEPPQGASLSSVLESYADSQLHPDQSNLPYDRIDQHPLSETDDVEAEEDGSIENFNANHVSSATVASRKTEDNSGDASLFDLLTIMSSRMRKYTPAIDIWSIGCIFVEVLTRKPLFPGKSIVHQLDLMTDFLGSPSADTIYRIRNKSARKYLADMCKKRHVPFAEKFPNSDPLAICLLQRLLAFDPIDRPTAEVEHS